MASTPVRIAQLAMLRRRRAAKGKLAPTFIVGAANSGTTVVRAILGTSPEALSLPYESGMFHDAPTPASSRLAWYRWLATDPISTLVDWERAVLNHPQARTLVEKTPTHILALNHLLGWWPDSRVVIMVRNPLDVAVSWRRRGVPAAEGARMWARENEAALPHLGDSRVAVFAYESFGHDLVGTLEALWRHVGIAPGDPEDRSPDDVVADPKTEAEREHIARRKEQMSQPLHFVSGGWREQLDTAEVDQVTACCRDVHAALSSHVKIASMEGVI